MRSLLILVAICFSATAFAQSAPPKVGNKPVVRVKPKEPMGCKLVGTVRGTKLWAGDCVGPELGGRQPRRKRKPCLSKRPERPTRKSESHTRFAALGGSRLSGDFGSGTLSKARGASWPLRVPDHWQAGITHPESLRCPPHGLPDKSPRRKAVKKYNEPCP